MVTTKRLASPSNWVAPRRRNEEKLFDSSLPARWTGGSVRYNLLSQHPPHHHPSIEEFRMLRVRPNGSYHLTLTKNI